MMFATNSSISVVMPSFNRETATARAIRSALCQERPVAEVVVVDDASWPPLDLHALPRKAGIDVRVVRLAVNSGAAAARQAGVESAQGDLVAFLDSDDEWLPSKIGAQLEVVARAQLHTGDLWAVSCGWDFAGADRAWAGRRIPVPSSSALDFAAGCWFCPGSTVLLPRACFRQLGGFAAGLRRLEDYEWFLRFGLAGGRLLVAQQALARINVGRRATLQSVAAARAFIEERWLPERSQSMRRSIGAYLALEMARAALNERRYLLSMCWLGMSLLNRPRLRVPLKPWWKNPEPHQL